MLIDKDDFINLSKTKSILIAEDGTAIKEYLITKRQLRDLNESRLVKVYYKYNNNNVTTLRVSDQINNKQKLLQYKERFVSYNKNDSESSKFLLNDANKNFILRKIIKDENLIDNHQIIAINEEFYKEAFQNRFYFLNSKIKIKTDFVVETKEELNEFFKNKIVYIFNQDTQKIEKIRIEPKLVIYDIQHYIDSTEIKIGFSLSIGGKEYTEADLLYENGKYYIKNIFDSEQDLINNYKNKYTNLLNFFNELEREKNYNTEYRPITF